MADALCGPSNALQTFQKQTSVDRTLQQDRLAARHEQAESFRSLPGPSAGALDAEFEAFQAASPLEAAYLEPPFFSLGNPASSFRLQSQQHLPAVSNWASDFQKLNLDEPRSSPISQSQFHQHAPLQHTKTARWHEELSRQQNQSTYQQQQHQNLNSGWANGYANSVLPQQNAVLSSIAQQKQPDIYAEDIYDEAAFEQAFENVQSEMYVQRQNGIQLDRDLYRTQEAGEKLKSTEVNGLTDDERILTEHILHEEEPKKAENNDENDADELARTAGQLLENVKGDQSRKFQESNFLSLMRQLRDKEVRVKGDKLVDVVDVVDVSMPSSTAKCTKTNAAQPLHPGGLHYPNGIQLPGGIL